MFPAFIAAASAAVATPAAKAKALTLTPEQIQALQAQAQSLSLGPKSYLAQHAGWLTHTFAGFFILSAVLLVLLLAVQTTKQEGLGGTIGGRIESAYKGRLGFDGQISRLTTGVAIAFVFFATLISISGI